MPSEELVRKLADNGQIATQYVDEHGVPGMDVDVQPQRFHLGCGGHHRLPTAGCWARWATPSVLADGLYKNVDGCYDMKLFQSAKKYFDI